MRIIVKIQPIMIPNQALPLPPLSGFFFISLRASIPNNSANEAGTINIANRPKYPATTAYHERFTGINS